MCNPISSFKSTLLQLFSSPIYQLFHTRYILHKRAYHHAVLFHVKITFFIFIFYQLFHTRYTLHKRAYHHAVSDAIDLMVAEAIVLANPYLLIPGYYHFYNFSPFFIFGFFILYFLHFFHNSFFPLFPFFFSFCYSLCPIIFFSSFCLSI